MKKIKFTESELKVLAMDYEGWMSISQKLNTTITGDGELAQNMVDCEVVRRQIFEKIKHLVPRNKEEYISIKPTK